MDRAETVGAGIAAADDHDVLVLRGDELIVGTVTLAAAVLQREELHRKVDPLQFAARHRQIARRAGAARQQDGIEVLSQARRARPRRRSRRSEHDAFGFHHRTGAGSAPASPS